MRVQCSKCGEYFDTKKLEETDISREHFLNRFGNIYCPKSWR